MRTKVGLCLAPLVSTPLLSSPLLSSLSGMVNKVGCVRISLPGHKAAFPLRIERGSEGGGERPGSITTALMGREKEAAGFLLRPSISSAVQPLKCVITMGCHEGAIPSSCNTHPPSSRSPCTRP